MFMFFGSVEYSRVQVPEEWDHLVLEMDRNDPYIKYRDGFGERATFQSSYNDMNFHHNKVVGLKESIQCFFET
jgi:hypothetical protein